MDSKNKKKYEQTTNEQDMKNEDHLNPQYDEKNQKNKTKSN